MKYLIAFLIGFILCMATLVYADILYQDSEGWYSKDYNIRGNRFDMCECIKKGYEFYPNKREYQKNLIYLAIEAGSTNVRAIREEIGMELVLISRLIADMEKTNRVFIKKSQISPFFQQVCHMVL